jgi:uncharacterized protein (DUF1778 family)
MSERKRRTLTDVIVNSGLHHAQEVMRRHDVITLNSPDPLPLDDPRGLPR